MPAFSPLLARLARYTALVLVGFVLLYAAAWKGWIFPSDRQVLPRTPDAAAIKLPAGYRAEVLASGLNAPSALEITRDGSIYIGESGYGGAYASTAGYEGATPGRVLRLSPDGTLDVVAGGFLPPLAGFVHDDKGTLYVSHEGTVTALSAAGDRRDIVSGLPSMGDHKNNNLALGPDGRLYLTQGTVTNSGIVGLDNYVLWGRFFPAPRDIPCREITLRGVNVTTADPRSLIPYLRVSTGAFSPFGTRSLPGQAVKGQVPCSGAILRVGTDGKGMEVVAWGLRNPFDLRFDKAGQLWVTENGPDSRGSRPIDGAGDLLHRITPGAWYGWPDYWNGTPVSALPDGKGGHPQMLLARQPARPEKAFMDLGEGVSADGFDFAPAAFGYQGQLFIAQWGSGFPATHQEPNLRGFNVLRVDPAARKSEVFASNKTPGPASLSGGRGGFERPVAVRFGPDGAMYVLDWGHMAVTRKGPWHVPDTGVLWRISKVGAATLPYRYNPSGAMVASAAAPAASAAARPPAAGRMTAAAPAVPGGPAAAQTPLDTPPVPVSVSASARNLLPDLRLAVAVPALGAALWIWWRRRRSG